MGVVLHPDDHARIRDHLRSLHFDVPAAEQRTECCDRIWTRAEMFNGAEDHVLWESPSLSGRDQPGNHTDHGQFIADMQALHEWLRSAGATHP